MHKTVKNIYERIKRPRIERRNINTEAATEFALESLCS